MVSADGLLGRKYKILLKQLFRHLAEKWECPPSQAHNYAHAHMSVAIARATHHFLHGYLDPSYISVLCFFPFEDGAGTSPHQNISD